MAAKYPTCRVLSGKGVQCTGEAVAVGAELLICTRHLAEAMRLLKDIKDGALAPAVPEARPSRA